MRKWSIFFNQNLWVTYWELSVRVEPHRNGPGSILKNGISRTDPLFLTEIIDHGGRRWSPGCAPLGDAPRTAPLHPHFFVLDFVVAHNNSSRPCWSQLIKNQLRYCSYLLWTYSYCLGIRRRWWSLFTYTKYFWLVVMWLFADWWLIYAAVFFFLLFLHCSIWRPKRWESVIQTPRTFSIRGCTGEFWNKIISLKLELNVVGMVCWTKSCQNRKLKKLRQPFRNGSKHVK